MIELALSGLDATRGLARRLGALLRTRDVIALDGPLGAGKTALAREVIVALAARGGAGPVGEVPSPTFTLVQVYDTGIAPVWHFDLYRLTAPDDALELDIDTALAEGITLIEWPDRLGPWLPADRLALRLDPAGGDARRATISGTGPRGATLEAALGAGA